MKTFRYFLAVIGGLVAAVSAEAQDEGATGGAVPLVQDGVSRTAVVLTTNDYRRLKPSVDDLIRCLEKMSGAKVPLVTNVASAAVPVPILVGERAAQAFGPPKKTSPLKQGWRLAVSAKAVGLVGESDEATSYAIYELLDRLGCRWFMPSDMGEVIPAARTIRLPLADDSDVPATAHRRIWYADDMFRRGNRLNSTQVAFGHALETSGYVGTEPLKAHPDWNAEIGGKRGLNGRYCWANAELADAIADTLIARVEQQGVRSFSLCPNDGIDFCECAKCRALDAGDWDESMNMVSGTDRLAHFCNRIAARVVKKHPDVLFGFYAYVQYTRPPVREKVHPNIVVALAPITYCRAHSMADTHCPSCQDERRIVEGWGKSGAQLAFRGYGFNLAEVTAPYPMIARWSQDIPVLYANHVTFWMPETMATFDSSLPGLYLGTRMSCHTRADPKDVLSEFYDRFYGAASAPMRRYWETTDDAWTKVPEHAGCGWGHARRFTPETMKAARAALNEAQDACRTDMEKRRVALANDSFRQFELFMKMRGDLFDGRLAGLAADAAVWQKTQGELAAKYAGQCAFGQYGAGYVSRFYLATYNDATRIATNFVVRSAPLRAWRYAVDKEKRGEALGWSKPDFSDQGWKTTDSCVDTWYALGLERYYGPVWYRTAVKLQPWASGRKIYLWISATDGNAKVFVNGKLTPYATNAVEAAGYAQPFSFDITAAAQPGATNQIAIVGTRTGLNELGTGGLLGPVYVYGER